LSCNKEIAAFKRVQARNPGIIQGIGDAVVEFIGPGLECRLQHSFELGRIFLKIFPFFPNEFQDIHL